MLRGMYQSKSGILYKIYSNGVVKFSLNGRGSSFNVNSIEDPEIKGKLLKFLEESDDKGEERGNSTYN